MKFLVDAQLPRRLSHWLQDQGHDSVHTKDFTNGNRTGDREIIQISIHEQRVVISKDADFVDSFLVRREPHKLLLISTGNIRNDELERLSQTNLESIVRGFENYDFIELDRQHLTYHF